MRPALRAFTDREIRRFTRGHRTFGERHADAPLLVLTTIGRRSGIERRTPLVYLRDGGDWIISGGAGGVPWTPDWVLNLRASGSARIEITPGQDLTVMARELNGAAWDACWQELRRALPLADSYQRRMDRRVPIFRLTLQPPCSA